MDVVTPGILKKLFYRSPGFLGGLPGVYILAFSVTTKELISKGHLILNFRCYVRAGTTANSDRLNWCMSVQCGKKSVIKHCEFVIYILPLKRNLSDLVARSTVNRSGLVGL